VLAGLNRGRLDAAAELGASRTAAFDATDPAALEQFFAGLPVPVDHVMVTGPGPYYAPLADLDQARAHRDFDDHPWLAIEVARLSVGRVRAGGTLLFMAGTSGRGKAAPSRPGSSTRPCPRRCSVLTWTRAAPSSPPSCPSGGWSARPTSRRWLCTS
jgi:hypothetical protein